MIRNVIFDFGQVLVRFDPIYMTEQYIKNAEDAKTVADVVFDRLYWDALDKGTIPDSEVVRLSCERLEERFHPAVSEIYYNWIYNIPEICGMRNLLEKLKARGIKLFLLSNISCYFADHSHEISVLSYFEKCIFSAVCGHTKPHRDMFEYALSECNIRADETLFVDDNKGNIDGAASAGVAGYLFDGDVSALESFIDLNILS